MSKPPCPECDYTHSPDEAQAIGIFDPAGPFGYIAKHDGGNIYATRQEVMQAVCDRRRHQMSPTPTQPTTEAAPNRAASFMPGDIVTVNNPGSVWHGRVGRVRYNLIDTDPVARIDFPDLYSKLIRHEHLTEGEQG